MVASEMKKISAPLNDAIIVAVAQLIDDAQSARRDPSHSDLEFHISRANLTLAIRYTTEKLSERPRELELLSTGPLKMITRPEATS